MKISNLNIPLLLLAFLYSSCDDAPAPRLKPTPACSAPKKITVYKEKVYDLNGYADEGNGDPFRLFDENAFVDPGNESNSTYRPHTNPQPMDHPAIYFPAGKGNRIVVDLQTTYRLNAAYLYDRSNSRDSVWIYTGDMHHWKEKAAFTTIDVLQSGQWRRFLLDDSSRFLMIRFSSPQTAITEMVLYGCSDSTPPAPPAPVSADPGFTRKTMKEFLGVNDYSGIIDSKWLKPFYYTRLYSFAVDYDRDTIHIWPDIRYNMTHFGFWDGRINDYSYWPEANVRQNHHEVWYTMQGLPLWMARDERDKKGRPVTRWGMDPEDAMSYARHAGMMWNLAAWFGHQKQDTSTLSLDHSPIRAARGTMRLYENGSEDDATWSGERYCSPMAYFAQSSADFDGAEGALGKRCGIANADSGSALMTAGMIELDTNRIKVYKFLCSTLRKDGAFLWKGGVQFHHYSTNYKHGITPEEDSLRWRLSRVKAFTERQEPGVPCILGENGYDKSQLTRQSTPRLPGLANEESQAVFLLRSVNATAFSGFDAYMLYWLRDNKPPDDPGLYLSSGVVREMPDGSIRPYPSWFYLNAFESRLADYRPDRIISEKGSVWIYKYRNVLAPDSVGYFIYEPTHDGSKDDAFALTIGKTAGDATEIDFAADSAEGNRTPRKVVNGAVRIAVAEKPKLVFVKELNSQ
jgi:hypothetical protein